MNIKNALSIIQAHLEKYGGLSDKVGLANAADTPPSDKDVIISLVKFSEETTLRNGRFSKVTSSFKVEYKNRPIYSNLFLLFTAVNTDYESSLITLTEVIEFFQANTIFTELDGESDNLDDEKFRIIMEHQNLSLEQVNHLWGFLGGKQKPSVLYKARLVPIEAKDQISGRGEPILEINIERL